jgi:hypothetical protein
METLIHENEKLRSENLDILRRADTSLPLGAEEAIAGLEAQRKTLIDENAILVEQKVHLSNELDKQQGWQWLLLLLFSLVECRSCYFRFRCNQECAIFDTLRFYSSYFPCCHCRCCCCVCMYV